MATFVLFIETCNRSYNVAYDTINTFECQGTANIRVRLFARAENRFPGPPRGRSSSTNIPQPHSWKKLENLRRPSRRRANAEVWPPSVRKCCKQRWGALKLPGFGSAAGLILGILAGWVLAYIEYQAARHDPLALVGGG
jgi:hypothetical protein